MYAHASDTSASSRDALARVHARHVGPCGLSKKATHNVLAVLAIVIVNHMIKQLTQLTVQHRNESDWRCFRKFILNVGYLTIN